MSVNFSNYLIWKYSTTTQIETGNIDYQGASIRYVSYGQGEPLLLLHGGLSNKLSWFSQIPWLVDSGRRVVLIDTRGHGDSTHGNTALSYQIFAQDVLQVLNKLGIQRTDIVGWSDGGIIALLLGLETPQRVGRIVAISANFHPSGLTPESSQSLNESHNFLLGNLTTWGRGWWSGAGDEHPMLEAEIKELWRTAPLFTHSDLRSIEAKTLIVTGENDIIEMSHSGELAQMLSNGQIEIVLEAGHAIPITHAKELNQLIASFLGIKQSL
ncbi:MAG: alpha/beta hydrolase [Methylococcales bacterium]|nr:alpha/beta hydrolase [Methylococcales bacterium]MDD5754787.1 alpha/beta hydrolase [Methylococcales bacterium]